MTTKYIPITPLNFHSEIRIDTHGDEVVISVYNCSIEHLDLLIQQLEALKGERAGQAITIPFDRPVAKIIPFEEASDEPVEMTAVLGPKVDPTGWYKNALQKVAAQPVHKYTPPPVIKTPDPEMPKPKRGAGIINIIGVTTKSYKNYGGSQKMNENADICKNKWIRIYGISDEQLKWDKETKSHTSYKVAYDRTFKIGDTVEYRFINFSFTGKIVAIGEKTIKIDDGYGSTRTTQLDIHTFITKNWDLDLKKIAEDRANWYD